MLMPTLVRRFLNTVQCGSVFVVLAVVLTGCSKLPEEGVPIKSGGVTNVGATNEPVPAPPVVVVIDPPTEPSKVTLPDPEAEQVVSTEKWFTDFDKAKAAAEKEGKDMFIEFTGSDWCPPCIRFHETILQFKNFSDYANQRFILLKLDFPRGESDLTDEERAKNDQLAATYSVDSFPTILLADSNARVYSQLGFQPLSIREFAEVLESRIQVRHQRDLLIAEASLLKGVERAKKLEEAILKVGAEFSLPSYDKELAEIVVLDHDNAAGLNEKYKPRLQEHEFSVANSTLKSKLEGIDDFDETLAEIAVVEKKFASYEHGLLQLSILKAYVYKDKKKVDELIKFTEPLLTNKELMDDIKIQLRVWRMQGLMDLKRYEEANKEMDLLAAAYPDHESLQVNVLLFRAKMQVDQGNRDEAKVFIEQAKKTVSDPRVRGQIADYGDELLGEEKPADSKPTEEKPVDPKPADEKPTDEKPADEKPADEKKAEDAKPAPTVEPAKPDPPKAKATEPDKD